MADQTAVPDPQRIQPQPIEVGMSVSALLETACIGSTAGQLADAARLLTGQVLSRPEMVVGLSLDATLTPGGIAVSTFAPLLEGGYVDWLAVTGTNLYYDALFSLCKPLYRTASAIAEGFLDIGGGISIRQPDREDADKTLREILSGPDFQRQMSSAAMHELLGKELRAREKLLGVNHPNLLTSAAELGVPIFDPAPADSPLGSLVADLAEVGNRLLVDPSKDLNQTAAMINSAAVEGAPCAALCFGRGAAANFLLGVPAHLQRILGPGVNNTYAVRLRMAGRAHAIPGTGNVPVDSAGRQPDADLALSTDLSVALPILVAHILDRVPPRPSKRLVRRRADLVDRLRQDHLQVTLKRPDSR